MVLPEIFRHSQAIANFGCDGATSLVHELQVARCAVVVRVVCVHGEWVLAIIVRGIFSNSCFWMDHTEACCSNRMLIDSPNDGEHKVFQRFATIHISEAQWLANIWDHCNACLHHGFKELNLQILILQQFWSTEFWNLQCGIPGFPVLVDVLQQWSSIRQAGSRGHVTGIVQRTSDKGRKGMQPVWRVLFSHSFLIPMVFEVHGNERTIRAEIQHLCPVLLILQDGLRTLAVSVFAHKVGMWVLHPPSVEAKSCAISKLHDHLLSIIHRLCLDNPLATFTRLNSFVAGGRQGWYQVSQVAGEAWSQWPRKFWRGNSAPVHQALTESWWCDGKLPMDPLAQANSFSFDGIGHLEGPHGDLSTPWRKIMPTRYRWVSRRALRVS